MAQLVCISSETHHIGVQETGDVVAVLEDLHVFSQTELDKFDILQVQGFTAKETKENLPYPVISDAYKSTVGSEWSLDKPEETEVWHRKDESTWYFLDDEPKFNVSVKTLDAQNITDLASGLVNKAVKIAILETACDRVADISGNLVEVEDLNS